MIHQCTLIKKSPLGMHRNWQWYSTDHSFVSHLMKYIYVILLLVKLVRHCHALLHKKNTSILAQSWWRKKLSVHPSLYPSFTIPSLPLSPPLLCSKLIGCVLSGTVPFLQTGFSTNKTQCPWPVIPPVHTFTRTHGHTRCISMQQESRLWLCQSAVTHKYWRTSWLQSSWAMMSE